MRTATGMGALGPATGPSLQLLDQPVERRRETTASGLVDLGDQFNGIDLTGLDESREIGQIERCLGEIEAYLNGTNKVNILPWCNF